MIKSSIEELNHNISNFPKEISYSLSDLIKSEDEYYKKAENIEKEYFKLLDTLNKNRMVYLKDLQNIEETLIEKEKRKNDTNIEDDFSLLHNTLSINQAKTSEEKYRTSIDNLNNLIPEFESILQQTLKKYLTNNTHITDLLNTSVKIFFLAYDSIQKISKVLEEKINEHSQFLLSKQMTEIETNYSLIKPLQNIFIPYEIKILKKSSNDGSKKLKFYDSLTHTVVVNLKKMFKYLAPEVR